MTAEASAIRQTRQWIEQLVIGHNLCPFARRPFETGAILYQCAPGSDAEAHLHRLAALCRRLDEQADIETALLIFTDDLQAFEPYLDFLELANALLAELGYEGIYQLASFHPDYRFADSPADDAANYSNRSPWPMLHLIREDSISAAAQNPDTLAAIPAANCARLRQTGKAALGRLLENIRHHEES